MSNVIPLAKPLAWIVDLDLQGIEIQNTASLLKRARQRSGHRCISYRNLRGVFEEELRTLQRKNYGSIWFRHWRDYRIKCLPRHIQACERNGFVSLEGLDAVTRRASGS